MDLTSLDNKPVSHVVELEIGFQNAVFIKNGTATNLWNDFVNCWAYIYTEFREAIRLDREKRFMNSVKMLMLYALNLYLEA